MTYQDFQTNVVASLKEHFPSTTQISIKKLLKNNSIQLDGLLISEENRNIAPTIYLNYYYDRLQSGRTFDQIVEDILNNYQQHKMDDNVDISFFMDFESVRGNIIYKLINYEKNQELLSTIPFIPYLDLAIVFCYLVDFREDTNATILIHNTHMKEWNMTAEDLLVLASENTPRLMHYDLRDMRLVIEELLPLESSCHLAEDTSFSPCGMYVLTNHLKLNGACCILYQNLLQEFAQKIDSDLFILPSSIHEVLLVPAQSGSTKAELTHMVEEVNTTQVAAEEILSDHVYFYSKHLNSITC